MPEPNGLSKMPWWIRAVEVTGILGALVIYLVWINTQEVPAIRIATELNSRELARVGELMREHITQTEQIYRILQKYCVSLAKDDNERKSCFNGS